MISFDELEKRICDVEKEATNTETYREFIKSSEETFGLQPANVDGMNEPTINDYIDTLNYLWEK